MKISRFIFNIIALAAFLFGLASTGVCAQDYPKPVGYINDFANILSGEAKSSLDTRLSTLEKETSAEVVFVSIDTIGNSSLEEYAAGLFENWGIGKKGKDNGVLFLVSLAEGDIRIEVGYGLESVITDGRAGRILDDEVVPYLKEKDFDMAIESGLSAIEEYIRADTPPSIVEENPVQNALANFHLPTPLLIALGIITIYMVGFMARTRSIWLGGVWGIILGIILGFGFGSLLYIVLLPIGLGIGGLILDAILSTNYRGRSAGGLPTGWISSGGGFKGPNGGFGGFGGGMSGGGGAGRHF
jgi:uncharacterized protein